MSEEHKSRIKSNADGSKVLVLFEPIQYGSEKIEEMQIRKPKAKDLRPMPLEVQTKDLLDLGGRLAGHPPSVIDELCIEDTFDLLEIVGNFYERGRRTGSKA